MDSFFKIRLNRMEYWDTYRRNSKGSLHDPIACVHPRIFLGPAWNVDMFTFHQKNITHAINCAQPEFSAKWLTDEFPQRYVCLNAEDLKTYDITSVYPQFEETMNMFLADPNCKNVYVHCQAGMNRSAFLLAMYMCRKFQWKLQDVVKHITIQRPCCFENSVFRTQVTEYLKKLE